MLLIIEGIHNTGKTTLVEALQSYFKTFTCRRSFPELISAKNSQVTDFSFGVNCCVTWFAKTVTDNILFDRLHVSEYAYSVAIRQASEVEAFKNFRMIDTALSKCNVKMVFLTCDYDIICGRLSEKNQVYNKEDFELLTTLFDKAQNATLIKSIIIDTGKFNQSAVIDVVMGFCNKDE